MNYKADLHIHTVLSPCADLEMSPKNIVNAAKNKQLDIIAITDHNATHNCKPTIELGHRIDLLVIPGVEINITDIHFLAYFPDIKSTQKFQKYIDNHIPEVKNKESIFGYQLIVDEDENIINKYPWLLINQLNTDILNVKNLIESLNGILIPAHIDRQSYSILEVLGFIPDNLNIFSVEVSNIKKNQYFKNLFPDFSIINSSDAHYIHQIGEKYTIFQMKNKTFECLKEALLNNFIIN